MAARVSKRGAPQDERPRHGQGHTGNQSPGRHRPDKSEDPEKNPEIILLKEFGAGYYPGPFRPIDVRQSGLWVDVVSEDRPTDMGEIYLHCTSEQPFGKTLVDALDLEKTGGQGRD